MLEQIWQEESTVSAGLERASVKKWLKLTGTELSAWF